MHLEDLVARMQACVQDAYPTMAIQSRTEGENPNGMQDLRSTDYFDQIQKRLKKYKGNVDIDMLSQKFAQFDTTDTGSIPAFVLVNILKHNLPGLFTEEILMGLQYELECLAFDNLVNYMEFVQIFLQDAGNVKKVHTAAHATEIRLDIKKSNYSMNDYEDLLGRISEHAKSQCLDIMGIFQIFCKKSGFISYGDLRKIIQLLDFDLKDSEFELIIMFADETATESIHAYELALQICEAETVAPQFDIYKWIRASLELEGRYQLLEQVFEVMPGILQSIKEEYGHDKPYELNVLTAEQFQNVLRRECPRMSEGELDLIARYGIKGSRRTPQPGEILNLDLKSDMIHVKHFDEALCEVVNKMRKE